jgi:hypothetical protein
MALGSIGMFAGAASAASSTVTLTPISATETAGAVVTLTATASEAGTVSFSAGGATIVGCGSEVTVASGSAFVATCPWTSPANQVNPATIGATLTPTNTADSASTAATINVAFDTVALSGAAVYLNGSATVTATTYSPGAVTFADTASLTNCVSEPLVLNGNNTAYTYACKFTASTVGLDTASVNFTPSGPNPAPAGSATYKEVVSAVVLSGGSGAITGQPSTITATAYAAGTVTFDTVVGSTLTPVSTACTSVATTTATPFTATCAYSPAAGSSSLEAVLTPTVGSPYTSAPLAVNAASVLLSGGSAVYGVSPGTIVATTGGVGTVSFFTVSGTTDTPISGCTSVATGTSAPFTALCTWTPAAAGAATLGATFTPTGGAAVTSANFAVTVGSPIQGQEYPISLYVDTILASGSSGAAAPLVGAGCEIQNEFLVGQTIVFRVYGNDAQLGGAPLTNENVSSATVTIAGVATPLTLTYGSHGSVAFFTAPLVTGTKAGQYDTLGIIPYTVTVNTIAVPAAPAVTHTTIAHKIVNVRVRVRVTVRGHKVYRIHVVKRRVAYKKVWITTPATKAIPGATGTFNSFFNPASQATLNALPSV